MAIKIEQEIIGFSIGKEDEEIPEEKRLDVEHMHEDVARPEMLLGSTYKIKTPLSDHALYVTINDIILNHATVHEQRRPFEVFINSKNMEHFQWVTALTRVISAIFRKGGDVAFLPNELKQVFDPQGGYFKKGGRFMPSLVAEIGEAIESHMKSIGLIEEEELSDPHKAMIEEKRQALEQATHMDAVEASDYPDSAQLCMKCSVKAMVMMDNCLTCLNCGESKCG
jgi:hypothetical protein|tara:strand:- start:5446 stop:6120 length:675 start_codon:yes stop_codon:yes gene_type:complete